MAFRLAFEPLDDLELALLRSELEENNIRYMIQGEALNTLEAFPKIDHYNQRYVLILDEDLETAKPILEKYHFSKSNPP